MERAAGIIYITTRPLTSRLNRGGVGSKIGQMMETDHYGGFAL
jgi:hypothetical protein